MFDSSVMDGPIPPPLDLEDENWDDDVLPPPSACVSEKDDASMVPDLPPYVVSDDDLHEAPPLNPSRWLPDPSDRSTPTADLLDSQPLNAAPISEVSGVSPANAATPSISRSPPVESESTPSIRSVNDDTFCKCDVFGPMGATGIFQDLKPYVSPPVVQEARERTTPTTSHVGSSEATFAPHNVVSPSVVSTRYKTDKSLPEGMQAPHVGAKPEHSEIPELYLTQQEPLDSSKGYFYPRPPMAPEPSAPFEEPDDDEPNESAELESPLAMILNALDPSERTAFLVDQNKILETIQQRASNEEASLEAARKMTAMDADEELARKLQEEERAIRDERTTIAQCRSCLKNHFVPKGTTRAFCPNCKSVRLFEDKSKKKKDSRGGFFGIKKMKKK